MSCYRDGDLLTYRVLKRRAKNPSYSIQHGVVHGEDAYSAGTETVLVLNHALGRADRVPCEDILMHQPSLLAS